MPHARRPRLRRLSGQNMLVPVGVHFLYDFSALFLTWLAASRDANDRAQRAEQIMRANSGATLCTRSLVIVPVPVC